VKYFSMFSGIGGFELGIERAYSNQQPATIEQDGEGRNGDTNEAGGDVLPSSGSTPLCVGYSEVDKYAIQIYEKHFKGHKNYGDARRIVPEEIPDIDFLCGGFPCQAFSIAGKRAGFQDTRGTLFFEIARILADKKPKHFLLENVKGLLSHDDGRTFQTIIGTLTDLGYGVEWQVLNSKDFGVPQNRERVFIVGHLGGLSGRAVFPIGEVNEDAARKDGQRDDIAHVIINADKTRGSYIKQLNNPTHSNNRLYGEEGLSPALNTAQGGNRQPKIPVLTPDRAEKRQNGRRMKEDGDPSFTITAQDRHGVFDGARIRRLTPVECERLQGFPDGWASMVSDSQRYKCLGNAVTVNVIEAVMISLTNQDKA